MTNEYYLARPWRITLGLLPFSLLLFPVPFLLAQRVSGTLAGFLAYSTLTVLIIWIGVREALTSKIITSPEGIAWVSLGIRCAVPWAQVHGIEINPYQFLNLKFKAPVATGRLARWLGYDRLLQLSPYINDIATSRLLQDIATYANDVVAARLIAGTPSRPLYQRASTIGAYYLLLLAAIVPIFYYLRQAAAYLEAAGYAHATLGSQIISTSLLMALFGNGMALLGYPATMSGLSKGEAAILALSCYASPLLAGVLGFVVALIVGLVLRGLSITPSENFSGLFVLIGLVPAYASLRLSLTLTMWLSRYTSFSSDSASK